MTITSEQLDTLQDIADDLGADLRADYSGRGMYGKACVGFDVGRGESPAGFAMRLAIALAERDEADLADLMAEDVGQDSMGMGSVVYFPRVQAPEVPSDYEDEDLVAEGP